MTVIRSRLEKLEAKAGVGTPVEEQWRRVVDNGEPEIPQRIADLQAAGFKVIHRLIADPPARPQGWLH